MAARCQPFLSSGAPISATTRRNCACEQEWSAAASDEAIWALVRQHQAVIITNDEDFYRLADVLGFPPKVVMLRTGNQSTQFIAQLLSQHVAIIAELNASAELGVLELF